MTWSFSSSSHVPRMWVGSVVLFARCALLVLRQYPMCLLLRCLPRSLYVAVSHAPSSHCLLSLSSFWAMLLSCLSGCSEPWGRILLRYPVPFLPRKKHQASSSRVLWVAAVQTFGSPPLPPCRTMPIEPLSLAFSGFQSSKSAAVRSLLLLSSVVSFLVLPLWLGSSSL
ncbi:unnamed protein product [Coffea canephora]|uniref:DH200=94 genomic scaffold, scaffold_5239 n=1 Tax=Coffea canephora TaxID=49390 RepID=A0A068VLW9_COFCA|nr:unnamed protein product [Coffea canephora]